jgi:hypothetical protein
MLPTSVRCWECVNGYRDLIANRGDEAHNWRRDEARNAAKRNRVQRASELGQCELPGCMDPACDRHHIDDDPGNNRPENILGLADGSKLPRIR